MGKLRLDMESLKVESFAAELDPGKSGTVHGLDDTQSCENTRCLGTACGIDDTCHGCSVDFCTGDCTGVGAECYTHDPIYHACSADPCTGAWLCTRNSCYDTCSTCPGYC